MSKKESELVKWLQKGEHNWIDAFYVYPQRKKSKAIQKDTRKQSVWFNRTLSGLHQKGLCKNVPFIRSNWKWRNPGIEASKANLVALSIQETNFDKGAQRNPIQL